MISNPPQILLFSNYPWAQLDLELTKKKTKKVEKLKGLAFPSRSLRGRAAKICDKSCGNSISFEAFFNVYCHRPPLSRVFEAFLKVEKMEVCDIGRRMHRCSNIIF